MGLYDRACPGRRTIRFGPGDVCHSRVVGNAAIRETNRCAIAVRQLATAQITPLTDAGSCFFGTTMAAAVVQRSPKPR
jgi:hypothetical protein